MAVIIEDKNDITGTIQCGSNPDYPAASINDQFQVIQAGKIGGASGVDVSVGDLVKCLVTNNGGSQAAVGDKFIIIQGNIEQATETTPGYARVATLAEVLAGTGANTIIPPAHIKVIKNLGPGLTEKANSILFGEALNATADYAIGFGNSNTIGYVGVVFGFNNTLSNIYNIGFGSQLVISGQEASALGTYLTSSGYRSFAQGCFLTSSNTLSYSLGSGYSDSQRMVNNIAGAMFFGTNSTIPSLVVLGGAGPGTVGNIGVNITDPVARLDIMEGDAAKAPFRIRKNAADKSAASALVGEFQFSSLGELQFSQTAGEWKNILFAAYPSVNGKEYSLKIIDGVVSFEEIIDANGTAFSEKQKLQAGAAGDWVNGSYVGATSGAITGTKGGERFAGQDSTNNNYYRYECITDNNWIRSQLS